MRLGKEEIRIEKRDEEVRITYSRDVGRLNKNSDGKIAKNCLMLYSICQRHQILILKKDLESQNHCAFAFRSSLFVRPF